MRVMIVDDSRTARLRLRQLLPPALLADLVEVTSGSEALARCASETIGLMFLDLTMPGMDGYEVLRTLGARGAIPPTVVVSADAQPLARERVCDLGAHAFVRKPPNRGDLELLLQHMGIL